MGHEIGINKCKEALEILLSDERLDKRVDDAFSIIVEMNPEDTLIAYFKEIVEWCERYSIMKGIEFNFDGMSKKSSKEEELIKLSIELATLCTKIVKTGISPDDSLH